MRTSCEPVTQVFRPEDVPNHQRRAATERKTLTGKSDELQVGQDVGAPTAKVLLEVRLDNSLHSIFVKRKAVEVTA
jgi:hypothetical protein